MAIARSRQVNFHTTSTYKVVGLKAYTTMISYLNYYQLIFYSTHSDTYLDLSSLIFGKIEHLFPWCIYFVYVHCTKQFFKIQNLGIELSLNPALTMTSVTFPCL